MISTYQNFLLKFFLSWLQQRQQREPSGYAAGKELRPVDADAGIGVALRPRRGVIADPAVSQREVAVLRLMAGGYSNKEIARSLFLAEGTVKNYVSAILEKLDTRDRTRAVLKAITLRII